MRKKLDLQQTFQYFKSNQARSKIIDLIDHILEKNPTIYDSVFEDLKSDKRTDVGAPGMTAEQVLRCAILKQITQDSYEQLADRLDDSIRSRRFCRISYDKVPSKSALQANIKKIKPASLSQVNRILIEFAIEEKIEKGYRIRIDATVTESNIHKPTDHNLLVDCIRVITRLLNDITEYFPNYSIKYQNHNRRAKKRHFEISHARSKRKRENAYRDLLLIARNMQKYSRDAKDLLDQINPSSIYEKEMLIKIKEEIGYYSHLLERIVDQSVRRIIKKEKLKPSEKTLSIFEPHTDIIIKDYRETYFGHKIFLTGGQSNLITDCAITRGNPQDSTMFAELLDRSCEILGRVPKQTCTDGGFASIENAKYAQSLGVKDVFFTKSIGPYLKGLIESDYIRKKLRCFRAGIEGCISAVKRSYGLDRCNWRGFESFCSYVWLSIIGFNLKVLAKHLNC